MCLVSFSLFISVIDSPAPLSFHFPYLHTLNVSPFPPCELLYFLLPLAFSSRLWLPSSLIYVPSFLPSVPACWTGMNEPFCHHKHRCIPLCVCVHVFLSVLCLVCTWHTASVGTRLRRLFLGENTDAAFCFCSCLGLQFCFINAMVIWFSLLLWSVFLTKCRNAQRTSIDLSGSGDPVPLKPASTVSIFHECCWRKVAVGELQQTICSKQRT